MELEQIGYRYTKSELPVLMSLHQCGKIPAIPGIALPSKEQFTEGITSLKTWGIVENMEGLILVDKVHALLLDNLCKCNRFFSVCQNERVVSLCACPQMGMLVQSTINGWLIKPTRRLEEIGENFWGALAAFESGGDVYWQDAENEQHYHCSASDLMPAAKAAWETLCAEA